MAIPNDIDQRPEVYSGISSGGGLRGGSQIFSVFLPSLNSLHKNWNFQEAPPPHPPEHANGQDKPVSRIIKKMIKTRHRGAPFNRKLN